MIHLDVEGFELSVLKGAIDIINKYKLYIIVETTKKSNKEDLFNFITETLKYKKLKTIDESCGFCDILIELIVEIISFISKIINYFLLYNSVNNYYQ